MKLFNKSAHARLRNTSATKDIHSIIRNIMCTSGSITLQETNWATEELALLAIVHVAHLVRDDFELSLASLGQRDHFGELLSDDGLLIQLLAEDDALVAPFYAFFGYGSHPADHRAGHGPSLVVEIGHDHDEAVVFFAKQVVCGHFDVIKLDVCSCGGGGVGRLDPLRGDVVLVSFLWNHDHGKALLCPAAGDEVVGEHAFAFVSTFGGGICRRGLPLVIHFLVPLMI